MVQREISRVSRWRRSLPVPTGEESDRFEERLQERFEQAGSGPCVLDLLVGELPRIGVTADERAVEVPLVVQRDADVGPKAHRLVGWEVGDAV